MNFKLIISSYIILLYCMTQVKSQIIIKKTPDYNLLQCVVKIYKKLTSSRTFLFSNINENLNDFNSIKNSNEFVMYTEDSLNEINTFGPFHTFIFLIKSTNQFEQSVINLSKTNIWNAKAKFIIGYFGNEDIGQIFNTSWNHFVHNINVVKQLNGATNVYTFFPYQNKSCGKYINYELLASCAEEINDFFPNKIPLQLPGCNISVMALVIPPYVIDITKSPEDPSQTGMEITIIHNIAKKMNTILKIIPNPHKHWGYRYNDGNFTMMYKTLKDREVDIICGYMFANNSYIADFELSFNFMSEASIWFFPSASQLPQWQNMTNIFEPDLWLAIFLMFLINGIAWYFIGRTQETVDDFKDLVMCILNSLYILLQGSIDFPSTWKIRLIFLLWLITCLLIFTAHQSQLISILTSTLYERQMKTLEELIHSKSDFGFYPPGANAYSEKTPLNTAILNRYTPCPLTNECLNRTAFQRDFAVIKGRRQVLYLMPRYYTFSNGRPMLYDTDIVCFRTNQLFYMNKGYPLLDRVNNLLMLMQSNGLIDKWDKDSRFFVLKLKSDNEAEPLTLEHLQGAFYILFFGLFFATAVYFCEIINKKYKKPKN